MVVALLLMSMGAAALYGLQLIRGAFRRPRPNPEAHITVVESIEADEAAGGSQRFTCLVCGISEVHGRAEEAWFAAGWHVGWSGTGGADPAVVAPASALVDPDA